MDKMDVEIGEQDERNISDSVVDSGEITANVTAVTNISKIKPDRIKWNNWPKDRTPI